MPPTRRSRTSGGPAAKGSQQTLSFGASKLSKTTFTSAKDKLAPAPASPPLKAELGHVSSEPAVAEQAKVEVERIKSEVKEEEGKEVIRSPEEVRASKVTDAQIRRYWRDREAERRAPRVHQGDLSVEEKVLRYFDMSSQYGVSPSGPFSLEADS